MRMQLPPFALANFVSIMTAAVDAMQLIRSDSLL